MLHGKGNQYWMTDEYEEKRRKALEDRTKYSNTTLDELDILDDITLGGGKTDNSTYEIKQFPFPINQSIRSKRKMDIRLVDPKIGGE